MRVTNMLSNNGNFVPNQFILEDGTATYFKSCRSIIAKIQNGKTYLDKTYWDYSTTTGKYRNKFLNETKKETMQKIESGIYELTDLNP